MGEQVVEQSLEQTLSFIPSLGVSLLGFSIVFFVLIVLMCVIKILRALMEQMDAGKAKAAVAVSAPVGAPAPMPAKPAMIPAKGSLGEIKLHNVDDKTAAMLMAIVADELKAPLNELRFLSICEKK